MHLSDLGHRSFALVDQYFTEPVEVETLGGAVFGAGASGFSFSSLAGAADPNAFKGMLKLSLQ